MDTEVRPATETDLPALLAIYNHEVRHGLSNYESREQTLEDRVAWFRRLRDGGYPVLVASRRGQIAGFGAVTPFHPLSGYRHTMTGSLYVAPEHRRSGVAKALGVAMIAAARAHGAHTIIAGINSLNEASIRLHESFGFKRVGYFKEIGFKDGRWLDDVCLQLIL